MEKVAAAEKTTNATLALLPYPTARHQQRFQHHKAAIHQPTTVDNTGIQRRNALCRTYPR